MPRRSPARSLEIQRFECGQGVVGIKRFVGRESMSPLRGSGGSKQYVDML